MTNKCLMRKITAYNYNNIAYLIYGNYGQCCCILDKEYYDTKY